MFAALAISWFHPVADEFPHLPAIAHLSRFPCQRIAEQQVEAHTRHLDWLAQSYAVAPGKAARDYWSWCITVTRERLCAWEALADAHDSDRWAGQWWAPGDVMRGRRQALERLAWLLGDWRWRAAEMPGRIPLGLHPWPRNRAAE